MKKKRKIILVLFLLGSALYLMNADDNCFFKKCWKGAFNKVKGDPVWMMNRVDKELHGYKNQVISLGKLEEFFQKNAQPYILTKFVIQQNQLEVETKNRDPCERIEKISHAIVELLKSYSLPDMVFLISTHDGFSLKEDETSMGSPVFAMAKPQDDNRVILIPDFEALSGNLDFRKAVSRGVKRYPWSKKLSQASWRGATTGSVVFLENFLYSPRSQAVLFSLQNPEVVDARFTDLTQCNEPERVMSAFSHFFGERLSVKEQLKYKYQLLIDGNSCAYSRAYWQLFSNCAIFKQTSSHIQWYYDAIQPYVHYIPLKGDLSDLGEKIQWAQKNDRQVEKIAKNATKFARENLEKKSVYRYFNLLLKEYAKLKFQTWSHTSSVTVEKRCAVLY